MKVKQSWDENTSSKSSFFANFQTSGLMPKTLWRASLKSAKSYKFDCCRKRWRTEDRLGNIYRSWVICFWLHEYLVQPQPWIYPFCLQVIVVMISRLTSTLCSHKRERQSEFPQVHKQASKTDSEDHYLNVQGFPLLFVSLTCWQAIYHGPRHKLVLAVCSHSIREQHTVGYAKGKNLFKISCSNRWPYF